MLLDANGQPIGPTTMELARALNENARMVDQAFQLMHKQLFLLEIKNNFLFKKLSENGVLGDTIEKDWQEFASEQIRKGEEQMRKMLEEAEAAEEVKEEPVVLL